VFKGGVEDSDFASFDMEAVENPEWSQEHYDVDCTAVWVVTMPWLDLIRETEAFAEDLGPVWDYEMEVWVTTLSHELIRTTTIVYPFHIQLSTIVEVSMRFPLQAEPTQYPTLEPTKNPTVSPTLEPTMPPHSDPTAEPTSGVPTRNPTADPTKEPTGVPTKNPTKEPTGVPTKNPTKDPTPYEMHKYEFWTFNSVAEDLTSAAVITEVAAAWAEGIAALGYTLDGVVDVTIDNCQEERIIGYNRRALEMDLGGLTYSEYKLENSRPASLEASSERRRLAGNVMTQMSGENKYCAGEVDTVGSGFYATAEECGTAALAQATCNNGLGYFYYNSLYAGQCKCATDNLCSQGSYGTATGYVIYHMQPSTATGFGAYDATNFVELWDDTRCNNTANLGNVTDDGTAITTAQECANYVVHFGMEYRGCDGKYFSFHETDNNCYCTFFNNCEKDLTEEDSAMKSYVFTENYTPSIDLKCTDQAPGACNIFGGAAGTITWTCDGPNGLDDCYIDFEFAQPAELTLVSGMKITMLDSTACYPSHYHLEYDTGDIIVVDVNAQKEQEHRLRPIAASSVKMTILKAHDDCSGNMGFHEIAFYGKPHWTAAGIGDICYMTVMFSTEAEDNTDVASHDWSRPDHTYAVQEKIRLKLTPAEQYFVMVYHQWWYQTVIPVLTYDPPVFTELFSALNDHTGTSHMLTDFQVEVDNPWRYIGGYLIDSMEEIQEFNLTAWNETGDCTKNEFDECLSFFELDMLADSCFPDTKLTMYLMLEARRQPFYRSTKVFEYDLEITTQCAVVIAEIESPFTYEFETYSAVEMAVPTTVFQLDDTFYFKVTFTTDIMAIIETMTVTDVQTVQEDITWDTTQSHRDTDWVKPANGDNHIIFDFGSETTQHGVKILSGIVGFIEKFSVMTGDVGSWEVVKGKDGNAKLFDGPSSLNGNSTVVFDEPLTSQKFLLSFQVQDGISTGRFNWFTLNAQPAKTIYNTTDSIQLVAFNDMGVQGTTDDDLTYAFSFELQASEFAATKEGTLTELTAKYMIEYTAYGDEASGPTRRRTIEVSMKVGDDVNHVGKALDDSFMMNRRNLKETSDVENAFGSIAPRRHLSEYRVDEPQVNAIFYLREFTRVLGAEILVTFPHVQFESCCSTSDRLYNFLAECSATFAGVNIVCSNVAISDKDQKSTTVFLTGDHKIIAHMIDVNGFKNWNNGHYNWADPELYMIDLDDAKKPAGARDAEQVTADEDSGFGIVIYTAIPFILLACCLYGVWAMYLKKKYGMVEKDAFSFDDKYAYTKDDFQGRWASKAQSANVEVRENMLIWPSGAVETFVLEGNSIKFVRDGGEVFKGTMRKNYQYIDWSDGDVWRRDTSVHFTHMYSEERLDVNVESSSSSYHVKRTASQRAMRFDNNESESTTVEMSRPQTPAQRVMAFDDLDLLDEMYSEQTENTETNL